MTDPRPQARRLRVAVVGLGPKGLFALERLLDHAQRLGAQLEVDLFEPHPVPGAGPVYDPAQPAYLRMNFAADRLDMWTPQSSCVPAGERRSFVAWRRDDGDASEEPYPPRAQVGRYLADGLARLLRHAPPGASIALRPVAVAELERVGFAWRVHAAGGMVAEYDEVLVTAGHGLAIEPRASGPPTPALVNTMLPVNELSPEPLAAARLSAAFPVERERSPEPLGAALVSAVFRGERELTPEPSGAARVSAVFPVERELSPERVAPGAVVAVRGFALTFLDAALALTEGRGGRFESCDHPHRLRYAAGETGAGTILPFSRTGRPMLAKPDPEVAARVPALCEIARTAGARLLALGDGFSVTPDLVEILAAVAGAGLHAATGDAPGQATAAARAWLETAARGVAPPCELTLYEEIELSLDIASGLRPPDLQWALGHTWRSVYPALVRRLGDGGLPDGRWPAFRRLAAQLERVAFGPPPVNAAKLLALIDAGRVDLTHVAAGRVAETGPLVSLRSARGERAVDVVVNAVLAAPGAGPAGEDLAGRLVAAGHARILDGRRGLQVGPDAAVIGHGGTPTPGLSVIGRATEDSVTGNDTLSRTLHPHADRWAQRIARRAAGDAGAP